MICRPVSALTKYHRQILTRQSLLFAASGDPCGCGDLLVTVDIPVIPLSAGEHEQTMGSGGEECAGEKTQAGNMEDKDQQ